MRIAIATPVLYDRTSPFNHLLCDILGGFLRAGHTLIRFVAARDEAENDYMFGYSEGVEYKKYIRRESGHGNILARYLRDTMTNIREARGIRKCNADVLFEDVSYSSFWAVRAAKRQNMRIVAMVQDVWPDNAVQSGLIREGSMLYRFFEMWQRYVYRNADRIVCISEDMRDFLVSKGVERDKTEVIFNWGYGNETVCIPWEQNRFVEKYGLDPDTFYAVYAGNIGKMQNVELLVKAAEHLKNEKNVRILIVGDGARREKIEEMAKEKTNVTLLPLQPPELAEHIYSMAGVNIIPLVDGGARTAMPSKTGVVLSCGRPVIFCFGAGTEFSKTVASYDAGISVSATDEAELARAIIAESKKDRKRCDGADRLFQDRFTQNNNVMRYVAALR